MAPTRTTTFESLEKASCVGQDVALAPDMDMPEILRTNSANVHNVSEARERSLHSVEEGFPANDLDMLMSLKFSPSEPETMVESPTGSLSSWGHCSYAPDMDMPPFEDGCLADDMEMPRCLSVSLSQPLHGAASPCDSLSSYKGGNLAPNMESCKVIEPALAQLTCVSHSPDNTLYSVACEEGCPAVDRTYPGVWKWVHSTLWLVKGFLGLCTCLKSTAGMRPQCSNHKFW